MISTKNINNLPDRNTLRQICKSISVLDAIFEKDWVNRYYNFNSKWADGEELCEIRNGHGDHVLILFKQEGSVINGMTHEYYPKVKEQLTMQLPSIYHEFIFGEPVKSIGTTFCIWTDSNDKWTIGDVKDFNDGSSEILGIYDGEPNTYFNFAADYYDIDFQNNPLALDTIKQIYNNTPLTEAMIISLNSSFEHWEQLKEDLKEINYPSNYNS